MESFSIKVCSKELLTTVKYVNIQDKIHKWHQRTSFEFGVVQFKFGTKSQHHNCCEQIVNTVQTRKADFCV